MSELRIIPVVFGGKHFIITGHRMQYDYGQVLDFKDLELPDSFEARFSNSPVGESVGQIGTNNRIRIPKQFFESGEPIYCYITLHDEVTDGRTLYTTKVPIKPSSERTEEEPEPEEQSIITQAITALNTAVDVTSQKALEASESADRAEHAAEGIEAYVERAEAAQQASESARDRAVQAETSARTSAATASKKASEASESAGAASQSAIDAEQESERAKSFAESSAQSAEAARQFAINAGNKAYDASESAQEASGYASSANIDAQTASQKASEASTSALNASQAKMDAETAKQASETAQGLAESARDGAVTAKEDAESARDEAQEIVDGITGKVEQIDSNTERIESLEDDKYKPFPIDTASGAVASFPDGADGIPLKSCIVQVEPVQDLHGYDSPWPAGGGKNLFGVKSRIDVTQSRLTFTSDADYIIVNGTKYGQTAFVLTQAPTLLKAGTYYFKAFTSGEATGVVYVDIYDVNNTRLIQNIHGSERSYTFTEDTEIYVGIRVNDNNVLTNYTIGVVMSASSGITEFTPYSNECPISGFTGVELQRTGKNLLNADDIVGGVLGPNGVLSTQNVTINSKGDGKVDWTSSITWRGVTSGYIEVRGGHAYKLSLAETPSYVIYAWYAKDKSFMSRNTHSGDAFVSVTAPDGAMYLRITIQQSVAGTFSYNNLQLELGSTTTSYEPYQGNTYPITFPSEAGTVYGAHIDVINGELVVDREMMTKSASDFNTTSTAGQFFIDVAPYNSGTYVSWNENLSNIAINANTSVLRPNQMYVQSGFRIQLKTAYTSKDEFVSAMGDTPFEFCGKLVTPIHYPLTQIEIPKTLLGQNNLWANTGDTEVEYRADTKLYIEKLTQPEEYDMIADSAITSGQFFMVGNSLYRALANIASGATITVGTNAQRVSLSDALNLVNA